jgi:hypothetical protein
MSDDVPLTSRRRHAAGAHGVEMSVELLDGQDHRLNGSHVEIERHRLELVSGLVVLVEILDAEVHGGNVRLHERVVIGLVRPVLLFARRVVPDEEFDWRMRGHVFDERPQLWLSGDATKSLSFGSRPIMSMFRSMPIEPAKTGGAFTNACAPRSPSSSPSKAAKIIEWAVRCPATYEATEHKAAAPDALSSAPS